MVPKLLNVILSFSEVFLIQKICNRCIAPILKNGELCFFNRDFYSFVLKNLVARMMYLLKLLLEVRLCLDLCFLILVV